MFFKNVRTAINNHIERYKLSNALLEAKSNIVLEVSQDEHPDLDLDNMLQTKYCEVKYCAEDWLGSLQPTDTSTVTHSCHHFARGRCHNPECPVYAANKAYFEAQDKYEAAKKKHIASVDRIFGINTK